MPASLFLQVLHSECLLKNKAKCKTQQKQEKPKSNTPGQQEQWLGFLEPWMSWPLRARMAEQSEGILGK